MLDIWPNLPIHILRMPADEYKASRSHHESNLITALKRTDRICQIQLKGFSRPELERVLLGMQKPFPALTSLDIECAEYGALAVLPQAFLGGSAQHLRSCKLWGIKFPGIWKLLFTANHLVTLHLWHIPHSMHISPEGMATCLSTMPNLESLSIGFQRPEFLHTRPDQPNRLLSPLTRVVLPSLTKLEFLVMGEYIEDFVSRIDVPLLGKVNITFIDPPVFDTPRLHDFLARIEKFKPHSRGGVAFWDSSVEFELEFELGSLLFGIICGELGRRVSSMAQLCGSSLPLPSTLKRLDIRTGSPIVLLDWQDGVENTQWLDVLHPFTGVTDLRLGKGLALHYALALRDLAADRVTEVLPALQHLFVQGRGQSRQIREALKRFAAARKLAGLPVVVHSWDGRS